MMCIKKLQNTVNLRPFWKTIKVEVTLHDFRFVSAKGCFYFNGVEDVVLGSIYYFQFFSLICSFWYDPITCSFTFLQPCHN